jgi:hypothetical protein
MQEDFRHEGLGCAVMDKGNVEYCCEVGPFFLIGIWSSFLCRFLVSLSFPKAAFFPLSQRQEDEVIRFLIFSAAGRCRFFQVLSIPISLVISLRRFRFNWFQPPVPAPP